MKLHLPLSAVAAITAVLLCGCTLTASKDSAETRSDISSGQASVKSPDGTIELTIHGHGPLSYSIAVDGKPVLIDSRLGLKFKDGQTLGANARLARVERKKSDSTWENQLGKRRSVRDHHHELRAFFVEQSGRPFEIVVRAFDDGVGFRYVLPEATGARKDFLLAEEQTQFVFAENFRCYVGENENTGKPENPIGYVGSQESEYVPLHLQDLPTDQVRLVPLLV
ncbi:MAG: glycoside hydrolase family 97 N-terminal domain-containing protein [Akkermansiaceae bacterium]|nr:glycoside hydrolase family 97 N-terminal domain-containing protein [Verrucomicrobiales bacterium]